MGVWEEFCTVCGGPTWVDEELVSKYGTWLCQQVGISQNNEIVRLQLASYDGYGTYVTVDGMPFDSKTNVALHNRHGNLHGIVCHENCLKLVKAETGFDMSYNNLYRRVGPSGILNQCTKRYADMKKYQKQMFEIDAMEKDGNEWLLKDPQRPDMNRYRIVAMWQGLEQSPLSLGGVDTAVTALGIVALLRTYRAKRSCCCQHTIIRC